MKITLKILRIYGWVLALVCLVVLCGCYSYPEIPGAISRDNYTGLKSKEQRHLPVDCRILQIDEAKEISLANNPDYLSARHAVSAAWARFYSAFSGYLPQVTASYNMTENYYTPQSQGGTGKKDIYDVKGGGITAQWVIFDGLVTTMNTLSTRYSAKEAEAMNRDARRTLLFAVVTAYNNVLLSKARIKIATEDEVFNQELLRETQVKYDAGAVSLSEPLNFKVKLNLATSSKIQAQYTYEVSRCILAELLGLTDGTIPPEIDFPDLEYKMEQFPIDVTVYLDTALNNRPDLQAFRDSLSAAKYSLYASYGAFLPTVTANWTPLSYQRMDQGYKGRYQFRPRSEDRNLDYGFSASWVLFNGGQNLANMRQAQALLAQSELQLTSKWLAVVSEVRQAYENCRQSSSQVTLFDENLDLIRKTRDLVEAEYRAGNTAVTRLNEAQRDLVKAETDLADYQIGLKNAKAQLLAATGSE